jgi:hypothetical protein
VNRATNYLVQQGLLGGAIGAILGSNWDFLSDLPDWRAPSRHQPEDPNNKFVDELIDGTAFPSGDPPSLPGDPSRHWNVTNIYTASAGRVGEEDFDYALDNYVGEHRTQQLSGDTPRARASAGGEPPQTGEVEPPGDYSGFLDGSFESARILHDAIATATFPDFGGAAADDLIAQIQSSVYTLEMIWDVTGPVALHEISPQETDVQMTQSTDTSLGQRVFLQDIPQTLLFDLTVDNAQAGDHLDVYFDDTLLRSIGLTDPGVQGTQAISLKQVRGKAGTIRLEFNGGNGSVLRVDDFDLSDSFLDTAVAAIQDIGNKIQRVAGPLLHDEVPFVDDALEKVLDIAGLFRELASRLVGDAEVVAVAEPADHVTFRPQRWWSRRPAPRATRRLTIWSWTSMPPWPWPVSAARCMPPAQTGGSCSGPAGTMCPRTSW